jgi:hypothetical protein
MRLQLKALTERTPPAPVWRSSIGSEADRAAAARFSPGGQAKHAVFGRGEVIEVNSEPGVVVVRFDDADDRKLVASMAPLVPLSQDETG